MLLSFRGSGCRSISISHKVCGKYMGSGASSKVGFARERMAKKFMEIEKKKLEKARKDALNERVQRVDSKNYDNPDRYKIFEDNEKTRTLNFVLEENIRLLMARVDMEEEFRGLSYTLTRVRMHPSFRFVYVYWGSEFSDQERELRIRFDKVSNNLRHELEILGDVGKIPEVVFLKDVEHTHSKILEDVFVKVKDSMAPLSILKDTKDTVEDEKFDALRFNRNAVMNQVKNTISKAKEEKREILKYAKSRHGAKSPSIVSETTSEGIAGVDRRTFIKKFIAERNKEYKKSLKELTKDELEE